MKQFLRKKMFRVALLFCLVAIFSGVVVVYGQNSLVIDKDIILQSGRSIKFPDNSTLNSATGLGGSDAWTASSTKMYPKTANFVGIGTTNPTSPLYVVGTTTIAGVLQVGAGGGLGEAATSTFIYRSRFIDSDSTAYYVDPASASYFNGALYTPSVVANSGSLVLSGNGWGATITMDSDNNSADVFTIYDGSAERFRIDGNTGYVGINTTSPGRFLDVGGFSRFRDTMYYGSSDDQGSISWGSIGGGTGFGIQASTGKGLSLGSNGTWDRVVVNTSGNVGIGTASPSYKLHVAGVMYADEGTSAADIIASKIDGATFDPVYTIEGKRYATYMPGMVGGVKEELSDIATLVAISNDEFRMTNERLYSYTIDLNNKEKGSDEWLFARTIDIEKNGMKNIVVLLTPSFDGKVWYEKDERNKKITIFSIPSVHTLNSNNFEVSYRLTAPRFDAKDWTNFSTSEWDGLNIDAYYKK